MQENEIFIFYTVCSKFKYASFLFRLEQQLNIIIPIQSSARKKLSHFDLKNWIPGGIKIRPEIPSNWRIFESNWPDVESQFDSNVLQLLGISGQILVCQFDSQNRVNLTQIFSNYSEFRVEFYFHQWLKLLGQNGSFFSLCTAKHFFVSVFECIWWIGSENHEAVALQFSLAWSCPRLPSESNSL